MDNLVPVTNWSRSISGFQVDRGSFPEQQVLLVGLGEGESAFDFMPARLGQVMTLALLVSASLPKYISPNTAFRPGLWRGMENTGCSG